MFACPNCGGNLKFNISAQMLVCEQCQTQADPYAYEKKQADAVEKKDYDVTIFTCPQCGGEILSTDTSVAEFCTFCGASTILYSRLSKEKRPDYIIPFQKTKEECKKAYSNKMKKALFAPDALKNPNYIDGFRGIYMPYWVFDLKQDGDFTLNGTKTKRRGDYVYTDHYALRGDIHAFYHGLSYDASSSFDDDISTKIAPYYTKNMKPFTPAFLSGYYADTADVEPSGYENEAKAIAYHDSASSIKKSFSDVEIKSLPSDTEVPIKVQHIHRAMFPVWFMSYRNGNRIAYAAINGQTGKLITDLPIDTKKYLLGSLVLAIPIFLLLNLLFTIRPSVLLAITSIIAIFVLFLLGYEQTQIKERAKIRKAEEKTSMKKPIGFFVTGISILLAIGIGILQPVSDIYYYSGVMVTLLSILWSIKELIYFYNILATRRLPQFDRTGGDDRA